MYVKEKNNKTLTKGEQVLKSKSNLKQHLKKNLNK